MKQVSETEEKKEKQKNVKPIALKLEKTTTKTRGGKKEEIISSVVKHISCARIWPLLFQSECTIITT